MKPRNPMWAMTSKCGEKLLAKAASLIMMFKPSLKQTSVNHCMMVEKRGSFGEAATLLNVPSIIMIVNLKQKNEMCNC